MCMCVCVCVCVHLCLCAFVCMHWTDVLRALDWCVVHKCTHTHAHICSDRVAIIFSK